MLRTIYEVVPSRCIGVGTGSREGITAVALTDACLQVGSLEERSPDVHMLINFELPQTGVSVGFPNPVVTQTV